MYMYMYMYMCMYVCMSVVKENVRCITSALPQNFYVDTNKLCRYDWTGYVIVRPLSTVGYTSVAASVIHSRQWSN